VVYSQIGKYLVALQLNSASPRNCRFGWRMAFLFQLPLFAVSLALTTFNLNYVTPVRLSLPVKVRFPQVFQGKGKSPKDVLKRIDYGGSLTLLCSVCYPSPIRLSRTHTTIRLALVYSSSALNTTRSFP
jgi:hypothetical protein